MHRAQGIEGFRVDGLVDGQRVSAVLVDGRLECPPELLARVEIVVALGETFGGGDRPCVRASVTGGPTATLLTVLRAMSVVQRVEIVGRAGASGVASKPSCRVDRHRRGL